MKLFKRRDIRRQTQVLLNIEKMEYKRHMRSWRANIEDISKSGAKFASEVTYKESDKIILKFVMPDETVYIFPAAIRRVQKLTKITSYGVEFINLDIFDKLKLRKLIKRIAIT